MLNVPVRGKNTPVTTAVSHHHAEWVTSPGRLSAKYCASSSSSFFPPVIFVHAPHLHRSLTQRNAIFFCRVTLRLGGNWWSTVRHILCRVSFIDLLIYAISKHGCHHNKHYTLFYHTCSAEVLIAHKYISPEASQHRCILDCLVYISSGPA